MNFEQTNTTAPILDFQSTSTMQLSGSTHASAPVGLNAEGRATYAYNMLTTTVQEVPIRKIAPPQIGDEDPTPIGDALFPLMLMVVLYTFVRRIRRKAV